MHQPPCRVGEKSRRVCSRLAFCSFPSVPCRTWEGLAPQCQAALSRGSWSHFLQCSLVTTVSLGCSQSPHWEWSKGEWDLLLFRFIFQTALGLREWAVIAWHPSGAGQRPSISRTAGPPAHLSLHLRFASGEGTPSWEAQPAP